MDQGLVFEIETKWLTIGFMANTDLAGELPGSF
jgi:hypothetical protein